MRQLICSVFLSVCFAGCQNNNAIPKGKPIGTQAPDSTASHGSDSQATFEIGAPTPPPSGQAPNFQPLEGWKSEPPSNAMRAAQYVLPRATGETEDTTLVVFYFGGQGGTVEANFDRWSGQFQQPDGKDSKEVSKTSQKTIQGTEVHFLDVGGTYAAETAPGSGIRVNKPDFFSRNAVMKSTPGPYFVRLIGPKVAVERFSKDFETFIEKSLTPAK